MRPLSNTGVNDRDEWRNRILRALAELREGDQRILHRSSTHESGDNAPDTIRNP
jgi:hypothetical protein